MTFKKQITAVFLLMCILFTPALASSASAHAYDHVYTDVTVITPDSLEDVFGETEVERAAYTYELLDISNLRAIVAMEIELKIGHDYYTTVVSGTVNAYILPSGDKLYEGPIDGNMIIGEDEYRITIGFTKVESNDDAMISVTIQNDIDMVMLLFGDNVLKGEVLDFYYDIMNVNDISYDNMDSNAIKSDNEVIFGDGGATSIMIAPGIVPVIHPGDGGGTPPTINGATFQDLEIVKHDNNAYVALQARTYWRSGRNKLLVEVIPYTGQTKEYARTLGYDITITTLHSFSVTLDLEDDISDGQYGEILNINLPETNNYTEDGVLTENMLLLDIFYDVLSSNGLLSNFAEGLLSSLEGGVYADEYNDALHRKYTIDISTVAPERAITLDDAEQLLIFEYTLTKTNSSVYTGNTPYKVTVDIKYSVFSEYINTEGQIVIGHSYIDKRVTLRGNVDIQ